MVKITEITPKILKAFYDLYRETPHGHFGRGTVYNKVMGENIDEKDFDAAIQYMKLKGMIELTEYLGVNWMGKITAYGIEVIEIE